MEPARAPQITEPDTWTLVFCRKSSSWWTGALALGRFKHVAAFAYLPTLEGWIWYDVTWWGGTKLAVLPFTNASLDLLDILTRDTVLVRFRRRPRTGGFFRPLCCTTAIKHLVGLGGVTLRPDALMRQVLRHGGQIVGRTQVRNPATAG